MSFSREIMPAVRPACAELTAAMAGIGMKFNAIPDVSTNIEDTLVHASELGMMEDDLRVLAVLTTWFGLHHTNVNADRLVRIISQHPSERVRAYWAASAMWQAKDRRFARLVAGYDGQRLDLLSTGASFLIERHGEDPRFSGSALRVPKGTLRDRASDVLDVIALSRQHPCYRNRVMMGPSWRADTWTILEHDSTLSVAEIARRSYCSFATAWQVRRDFEVVHEAIGEPKDVHQLSSRRGSLRRKH